MPPWPEMRTATLYLYKEIEARKKSRKKFSLTTGTMIMFLDAQVPIEGFCAALAFSSYICSGLVTRKFNIFKG